MFQYARRRHLAPEKKKIFIKISSRLCLITVSLLEISSIIVLFKKVKLKNTQPDLQLIHLQINLFCSWNQCSGTVLCAVWFLLTRPPGQPGVGKHQSKGRLQSVIPPGDNTLGSVSAHVHPAQAPGRTRLCTIPGILVCTETRICFPRSQEYSWPQVERRSCSCAPLLGIKLIISHVDEHSSHPLQI